MSDMLPFGGRSTPSSSGALSRQTRRDDQEIAARLHRALAEEQAAAIRTAFAISSTLTLYRMTKAGLQDIPEAAPLVEPLLRSYSAGANWRSQWL
jgi:hypothetical protein